MKSTGIGHIPLEVRNRMEIHLLYKKNNTCSRNNRIFVDSKFNQMSKWFCSGHPVLHTYILCYINIVFFFSVKQVSSIFFACMCNHKYAAYTFNTQHFNFRPYSKITQSTQISWQNAGWTQLLLAWKICRSLILLLFFPSLRLYPLFSHVSIEIMLIIMKLGKRKKIYTHNDSCHIEWERGGYLF